MMSQLVPLAIGMAIRSMRQQLAEKLLKPANAITGILSVIVFALIIGLQYRTLADMRGSGYLGIFVLVLFFLAAGWIFAGQSIAIRKAVSLTTSARNVGVALVIATASFPDTAAVTSVIIFAIAQAVLLIIFALLLEKLTSPTDHTWLTKYNRAVTPSHIEPENAAPQFKYSPFFRNAGPPRSGTIYKLAAWSARSLGSIRFQNALMPQTEPTNTKERKRV